jgi:hypothetical protein
MGVNAQRLIRALPSLAAAGVAVFAAAAAFSPISQAARDEGSAFPGGEAGFVVTEFGYVLPEGETAGASCPNGSTTGYANPGDALPENATLQRSEQETEQQYTARSFQALFGSDNNLCMQPERGAPDPNFHSVIGSSAVLPGGIDLDGQASANTCTHENFRGANGDRAIDNQFFRTVGCSRAFQPEGQSRDLVSEMLTGTWGVLLRVRGVDNAQNDPEVEISFYANADPIEMGAGHPLAHATYSPIEDPRFRATARGRIVDGVLTSEPVDVRFYSVFNTVRTERPLSAARVRLTFTPDGGLEGYLAGYTPVEAMYDVQYGFRNGTEQNGDPASLLLRNTRSIGQAITIGYHTCQGAYQALLRNADGDRDPATGRCNSISTQYFIRAAPAFVTD